VDECKPLARGVYAWRVGGAGGGEGVAARSVRVTLTAGDYTLSHLSSN